MDVRKRRGYWHVQAEELHLIAKGTDGVLHVAYERLASHATSQKSLVILPDVRKLTSWPRRASLCQVITSFFRLRISA